MTKNQALRLKAFIAQVVTHPHLSNIQKIDKVDIFIDKLVSENR